MPHCFDCIDIWLEASIPFAFAITSHSSHLIRQPRVRLAVSSGSFRGSVALTFYIADILGARRANWNSILVHTGVYDPHKRPLVDGKPKQLPQWTRPSWEALDVESAVRLAINEELRREKCEVSVT